MPSYNRRSRCFIYCRVSTETQAQELSLDLQKKVCKDFATANKLVVSKVYTEVGSAYHGNQPQLKTLMSKLKPGMTILVYAMDRFTRNADLGSYLLDRIAAKKCRLVSITGEADQLGAIKNAQAEAEALGRRVRDRVEFMRRAGSHIGPAPFGYEIKEVPNKKKNITIRRLIDNDDELLIVELISMMRNEDTTADEIFNQVRLIKGDNYNLDELDIGEQGVCQYTTIAQFLNDLGIYCRGRLWTGAKVSKIYNNPI